jgi:hypothetical protein
VCATERYFTEGPQFSGGSGYEVAPAEEIGELGKGIAIGLPGVFCTSLSARDWLQGA